MSPYQDMEFMEEFKISLYNKLSPRALVEVQCESSQQDDNEPGHGGFIRFLLKRATSAGSERGRSRDEERISFSMSSPRPETPPPTRL